MNPVTIPLACMSVLRLGWSRCGEKVVHARAVFAQPYYQSPDSQSVRANKSRGNISPCPLLEGEGISRLASFAHLVFFAPLRLCVEVLALPTTAAPPTSASPDDAS